jgi:hypothetical protein
MKVIFDQPVIPALVRLTASLSYVAKSIPKKEKET